MSVLFISLRLCMYVSGIVKREGNRHKHGIIKCGDVKRTVTRDSHTTVNLAPGIQSSDD